MNNVHRRCIHFALGFISLFIISFNAALYRPGKSRVHLHRCQHEQWISWNEKHTCTGHVIGAVGLVQNAIAENTVAVLVKDAVAENAVAFDVLGDRQIK